MATPQKIYKSPVADVPLPSRSIFTHLLSSASDNSSNGNVGGFPGHAPAYVDSETGETLTRSQVKQYAFSLGHALLHDPRLLPSQAPLKRGDTVMVFSPNSLAWPVVLLGCVAAGLRVTLANSAYTARELRYQWEDSGARAVFVAEELLGVVGEMFGKEGVQGKVIVLRKGFGWLKGEKGGVGQDLLELGELLGAGSLKEEEKFEGDQVHETVYLCYSSGTTGQPKGVETTHRNMTSVLSIVSPVFPAMKYGHDVMLGFLPFYHIYGAVKLIHLPLTFGVPVIIQPRFTPDGFCSAIQRYKVTTTLVVPPVLVILVRDPSVDRYDLRTLKTLFSGAAPLGGTLVNQVRERLLAPRKGKGEGLAITQGYGLTETSPTTHLLRPEDALRKVGSIGILLPNLEARLVDYDAGEVDAKPGERGELWVRGPSVMKGYLNNKTATAHAITPDRWFKTGDVAIRDEEGFFWIVDRRKELIKYKGFQVPPAELESVLLTHPDVADAAVIGVESITEATELPRAYVVPVHSDRVKTTSEKDAFARGVQKWIQGQVARHKYLRGGVEVIDIIPKSASGKILRRELRERAKVETPGGIDQVVEAKL